MKLKLSISSLLANQRNAYGKIRFHTGLAFNMEGVASSLKAKSGQELSSGEDALNELDEEAA